MKLFYSLVFTIALGLAFFNATAQQDYSLSSFTEPAQSSYCFGTPVYNHVVLADSGGTGIVAGSLNIHWILSDGTTGVFTGPSATISPDEKDTLELDTFTFARPGAYLLTVYLDSADTNKSNDTLCTWIHIAMSGIYTVDGALPAAGNNFTTIAAACDTLSDAGVCGPVIIEIADGIYNEQAKIDRVNGVSSINNIILRSSSQDSSAVRMVYTPVAATDNYTLALNATSWVTIEHLTLESSGSTSLSRVLTIDSTCAYNNYHNLHLIAPSVTTNSTALAVIYSNPGTLTNDSLSVFENNILENGAYGMYLYGASSLSPEDSLVVRNNRFLNQYVSGIFMYYQSSPLIDSNYILTTATTTNFSGIYLRYGSGNASISRNTIIANGAAGDMIYIREYNGASSLPVLISNNFIFQQNNAATIRGIYPYNCNYLDIAYNTVRIESGTTTGGRAIYINSSTGYGNVRILNNILENNGGGYAMEISSTAITNGYISQCDYNDFNTSGSYMAKYSSTNCADLAAWQTTSSLDSHSAEIDPIFATPTSVEFTNAALDGLALPMATVSEDIYGTVRNATNPDMGAYEFELLNHDMTVLSIDAPTSGCGLSNAETVIAKFYNNGSMDESNVVASFSLNGGSSWSAAEFLPTIVSGDTLTYTFTHTANLGTPGVYNFKVMVAPLSDENMNNNIDSVLINSVIMVSSFPYAESFESGDGNWTTGGVNNSWQLGEPENTIIDTASSGVNCWVTNLTGNYNLNELSYVQSPCFDLSGMSDPWLEMDVWYEAEGGWDGAQVQYSTDGGNSWQTLGAYGDPDWYNDYDVDGIANNAPGWTGADANGSNAWITVEHSMFTLTSYPGIRLRVLFGSGSFNNDEGFAFDNVRIVDKGNNAGITAVTAPIGGCGLGIENISFNVINQGTVAITSLPVKISADAGTTWVNDTITVNIPAGSSSIVTSNQYLDFSAVGQHPVIVKAMLPLDTDLSNDSAMRVVISQPSISSFPYFDDFDSGLQTWLPDDSLWQLGTPSGTTIISAYSGTQAYSTCNNGFYTPATWSGIESPCFNFSGLSNPQVEFYYFANIEGGVRLQYTTDNNTWNDLGAVNDTLNWYTGLYGWDSDTMTNWTLARHAMPLLAGEPYVKFRFYYSWTIPIGPKSGHDGFAFDDFSIYEIPVYDLAMIAMDTLNNACEHGFDTITVWMQNTNFANTIPAGDTILVALNEGWLNVVTDTIVLSAPILPQQIVSHTFSAPLDMTAHPYTYNIEVELFNSHDAEYSNNALQQVIHSYGYPVVDLGSDTTLCGHQNVLLDAGSGADSYIWSGGSSNQTLLVDTVLSGGYGSFNYSVEVTTNGCSSSDTIEITFTDCTAIDELADAFRIYPNPAQDLLFATVPSDCIDSELSISDITGRIVLRKTLTGEFETINISLLPEGVYLLRINSTTSEHTQQIIIQR